MQQQHTSAANCAEGRRHLPALTPTHLVPCTTSEQAPQPPVRTGGCPHYTAGLTVLASISAPGPSRIRELVGFSDQRHTDDSSVCFLEHSKSVYWLRGLRIRSSSEPPRGAVRLCTVSGRTVLVHTATGALTRVSRATSSIVDRASRCGRRLRLSLDSRATIRSSSIISCG